MTTLDTVKTGQAVTIAAIADDDVAIQALRMGLSIGEQVVCLAKIPAGPIVIERSGMELALGKDICQKIEVTVL